MTAGGDDWFVPQEKPTFTEKVERAAKVLTPAPLQRVETAIGRGEVEGFGNEPLGLLSDEQKDALAKFHLLHKPGEPFEPTQAVTDFAIRYGDKAADALLRAFSAGIGGVAAGAGQVAREAGAGEPSARKLTADVSTMAQLGVMAPVPEALMEAPGPQRSSPEEVKSFLDEARTGPGAPKPPPSQTRADIDEFLRRRAEAEARQGQAALPAPDDWQVPPEQPAAAAATTAPPPAAGALDQDFSSYEEPGRAAPPAPQLDEAPPADVDLKVNNPPQPTAGPHVLQALLDDPRSAEQIRADLEAAKSPPPAAQAGEATAPIALPDQSSSAAVPRETAAQPPGHIENPVALNKPDEVFQGAEHTAEPTPGQAEAGNYRKRHVTWNGLPITIETEAGMARKGVGPTGEPWSVTLTSPYGYVKGTKGRDGEHVDVYLGPDPQAPQVYIVDQIDPQTGAFDEHKALIGYPDEASARAAYVAGFSDGSGTARLGALRAFSVDEFKDWLSKPRRAPIAYSDPVRAARGISNEMGLNATDDEIAAAVRSQKDSGTDLTDALVETVERSALAEDRRGSTVEQGETHGAAQPEGTHPTRATSSPTGEQREIAGAQEAGPAPQSVEPGEAQQPRSEPQPVSGIPLAEPKWQPTKTGGFEIDESELPKFTDIGDGYSARQYLDAFGKPRQEIKTPEGNVLIRGIQTDGKPYQEFEFSSSNPTARGAMDWVDRAIAKLGERGRRPKIEAPAEPEIGAGAIANTAELLKWVKASAKWSDTDRARMKTAVNDMMQTMTDDGRKIAEHCLSTGGKFSVRS